MDITSRARGASLPSLPAEAVIDNPLLSGAPTEVVPSDGYPFISAQPCLDHLPVSAFYLGMTSEPWHVLREQSRLC